MLPPRPRDIAPRTRPPGGPARQTKRRARPAVEALESRTVLYSASGNLWPSPQLITLSFMPDGTMINGKASNLVSSFNARYGSNAWQVTIEKAAQTWAPQTNINFAVVADSGAANGSGANQQGDPNFGDIRVGGYNFGSGTLAQAYMPPPVNNYSLAGDVTFNTGQAFGSTYDLYTVAVHEIGHALGLYHTDVTTAEEYGSYNGTKNVLTSDDVAGIRSIYSGGVARGQDQYGSNSSAGQAYDITPLINTTTLTALVIKADMSTAGQTDYYKFTVPQGASTSFTVTASSKGLSLLSPKLTVTDTSGSGYGTYSNSQGYGSAVTTTVSNATPGKVYVLAVTGSENTVFGTGAYGIGLTLGTNPVPSIPVVNTSKPNGTPVSAGGGQAIQVNQEALVNTTTAGPQALDPNGKKAVGMDDQGNYVVVWQTQNQDGAGWGVYAQRFDVNGNKAGGEFRVNVVTAGDQTGAAVAPNGDFVVTWQSQGQDGAGLGVYARKYTAAGVPIGGEIPVNVTTAGDQSNPVAAIDSSGNVTVAWQSKDQDGGGWGIYARRFNTIGVPLGGEFLVNVTTAGDQTNPSLAMDRLGNFVVAWSTNGQDGAGWSVYARRYNTSGAPLGGEFRVNSTIDAGQEVPSAAMDARGNVAVTWGSIDPVSKKWGVYARRYDALNNPVGSVFEASPTTTTVDQKLPAAAMDDGGDLLITWTTSPVSGTSYVGAQQYSANGTAMGSPFQVNSSAGYSHLNASIAINNHGNVVSVWTGGSAADKDGVFMQQYSVLFAGLDSGEEFLVKGQTPAPARTQAPAAAGPAAHLVSASPSAAASHAFDHALREFARTPAAPAWGDAGPQAGARSPAPVAVSHHAGRGHHAHGPQGPRGLRVRHAPSHERPNHAGNHGPRFF